MNHSSPVSALVLRPLQYRDLDSVARLASLASDLQDERLAVQVEQMRTWFGLLKCLSYFPNPLQYFFAGFVAELGSELRGFVQITPFNQSRTTWRVERVLVENSAIQPDLVTDPKGIGSQLLRHCFQAVWEARTWLLEVNIEAKNILALYRQNGFQPLAQMTYWALSPDLLQELAANDPDLPNLLPVSNADAQLLYQLDCVSMPPLMRQVFDRHPSDFQMGFVKTLIQKLQNWCGQQRVFQGYVFEPQRKAAIAYFKLTLSLNPQRPHQAELTVHPAYTWLYPKLLFQMAALVKDFPNQCLELVSADYQHEREEYLQQLGAERVEHTLLMSRSVWHKLKETKAERIPLAEVLQNLQPVPRTPIPSRMSLLQSLKSPLENHESGPAAPGGDEIAENGNHS